MQRLNSYYIKNKTRKKQQEKGGEEEEVVVIVIVVVLWIEKKRYTRSIFPKMTNNTMQTATLAKKKAKGRTFQCTGYPDCNMTFTRSEHLARHIRKHTGERPFECVHCSRKFSRLDNLRQHKQTVHAHEHMNNDYTNTINNNTTNNNNNNNNNNNSNSNSLEIKKFDGKTSIPEDHNNPNKENTFLQQQPSSPSDLPAAATSLLRPTQFRSKHHPRPIALPSRKSIYNDAPYTVPTPRSASSSSQLLLSPISPANSVHQLNYPHSTTTSTSQQHLPSVQFLTSNASHADSLISPYNSSFSSNISSANTPTNSSFDSNSRTPTNPTFTFSKHPQQQQPFNNQHYENNNSMSSNHLHEHYHYPQQHYQSSNAQPQQIPSSQQPQRRSWLTNVLNNNEQKQQSHHYQTGTSPKYQYNQSPNPSTTTTTTTAAPFSSSTSSLSSGIPTFQHPHSHIRQPSTELSQHNRVRIENLLNSSANSNSTGSVSKSPNSTNNENDRGIKLPHVGNLGIDITKN